jgi:hypothetical protein
MARDDEHWGYRRTTGELAGLRQAAVVDSIGLRLATDAFSTDPTGSAARLAALAR